MKRALRLLATTVVVLLIGIQFVPVERTNPTVTAPPAAPAEVDEILRTACYDCHSNETIWPWYSYVAPVSWFVANHVEHGRGDLNFSEWTDLPADRRDHKLEELVEMVENGSMPLSSYTRIHKKANLSAGEANALIEWARDLRADLHTQSQ